jgi:hypothetical protein
MQSLIFITSSRTDKFGNCKVTLYCPQKDNKNQLNSNCKVTEPFQEWNELVHSVAAYWLLEPGSALLCWLLNMSDNEKIELSTQFEIEKINKKCLLFRQRKPVIIVHL